MNLEGSLDAFGLPDVFALLAMTAKSGALRLTRPAGTAETGLAGMVWFHDGRVTGASADCSRQGLVRRLVGSSAVEEAALAAAVSRAGSSPVGVARALLEAGAVEPELLRQAAVDEVVDAVSELAGWQDGEFGFDPTARNQDDVGVALEHTWLVTEAKARQAAWDEIRPVIPDLGSVVLLPVVLTEDPRISRDEWAMLALVDGRRTVADLVELTGCGRFAVATVLAGLARRGLLTAAGAGATDHVGTVQRLLAMLDPVEGAAPAQQPVAPVAAVVAEPEEATPASEGDRRSGDHDRRRGDSDRRGSHDRPSGSVSAAQAIATARAAQGLPPAGGERAPATPVPQVARTATGREVVPPRPEPFLPDRRPAHPERTTASASAGVPASYSSERPGAGAQTMGMARFTPTAGNTAMVAHEVEAHDTPTPGTGLGGQSIIERDPAVNRSLLLRLIAGVRGL